MLCFNPAIALKVKDPPLWGTFTSLGRYKYLFFGKKKLNMQYFFAKSLHQFIGPSKPQFL